MILDRLENAAAWRRLGPGLAAAMDWIAGTDFARLEPGRYASAFPGVFAVLKLDRTRPVEQAEWEAHRRYIDVQCVLRGRETMGWASLRDRWPVHRPYDPATDLEFFQARGGLLSVPAGSFVIFTPQDIHAPGLAGPGQPEAEVLKVVIKVPVTDAPWG